MNVISRGPTGELRLCGKSSETDLVFVSAALLSGIDQISTIAYIADTSSPGGMARKQPNLGGNRSCVYNTVVCYNIPEELLSSLIFV